MNESSTSSPAPGALRHVLRDQCSALWRLDARGDWRCLYRDEVEGLTHVEGFVEFFASMCRPRLSVGAEVTAKLGDWMVLAVVDEQGILIGARNKLGNPITIRTAMSMIESRSQAPSHQPDAARAAAQVSSYLPSRAHVREAMRQAAPAAASSDISWAVSEPSTGSFFGEHHDTPGLIHDEVTRPEYIDGYVAQELDEESDAFSFDIVFQEESSVVEEIELADATISLSAPMGCSWQDACDHLEALSERMRAEIGRRVALNYWRDLLEEDDALRDHVSIDMARGRIKATSPGAEVRAEQRARLDEIRARWIERCALVVPHVADLLAQTSIAPWKNARS